MNITELTTRITFAEIEKALGLSMEQNDQLGAFNKVEIVSVDTEAQEVELKLSRKGRRVKRSEYLDTEEESTETLENAVEGTL